MTDKSTDVITALAEQLGALIEAEPELKGKSLYIYSPSQLSSQQQRTALPTVLFNYSGMRKSGRHHDIVFDVYLITRSESLSQIKNSPRVPVATELLQRLRKAIACDEPTTQWKWELESELPDFGVDDKLIYRQRWVTSYQIIR